MGQCRKTNASNPGATQLRGWREKKQKPGGGPPVDGPARPRAIIWNGLAVLIGQLNRYGLANFWERAAKKAFNNTWARSAAFSR